MSWDDDPFGDPFDESRRRFRRWLGDFFPESILREIEEMFGRIDEEIRREGMLDPEKMREFFEDIQHTSPFVFGFSMRIGPDGKPIVQRFGNVAPDAEGFRLAPHLEPLVDVIEEDDEIVVVAELPGVEKDQIRVRVKGTTLTIDVDNPERPYHKTVELPAKVKKDEARSSIRNGVLEVRLKKA